MSSEFDMDEHARGQFEQVREELKAMGKEGFETEFEELLDRLEVFDEETDSILLQFALESDEGVGKWRIQHLDTSIDGSVWDQQKYVRDYDEDDPVDDFGLSSFTVTFVKEGAPSPDEARKALYAAFRQASEVPDPYSLITGPDILMQVDVTDDGFSISYR